MARNGNKPDSSVILNGTEFDSIGDGSIATDGDNVGRSFSVDGGNATENDNGTNGSNNNVASSAPDYVDPAYINDDGTIRKRRKYTRRNGSGNSGGNRSRRSSASETTKTLSALLFSLHSMAAAFLKVEELQITEEESKQLGEAITRVTELYEIPMLDEKTAAWLNLGMVAVGVYGTRATAMMFSQKKKQPAKVVDMPFVQVSPMQAM